MTRRAILSLLFLLLFTPKALSAVMPEDFGARVNDGIDDTLAFQQAIDVASSTPWALGGGKVLLNAGTYDIDNPPLRINSSVAIEHDGSRMCVVQTSDTSHSLFVVDTPRQVIFRNIWIRVWPPQQGVAKEIAGILVKSQNCQSHFKNLQIAGFGTGIRFKSAHGWRVEDCYILCNSTYGIWIQNYDLPDTGGGSILSSIFDTSNEINTECAIFQEAGGGLRIVNTKLHRHQYGYKMKLYPNVRTTILIIGQNSIEQQTKRSIFIDTSQGRFGVIVITGNQINNGIVIHGSEADPAYGVVCQGNFIQGPIDFTNVIEQRR